MWEPMMDFAGTATPLSAQGFAEATDLLGVDAAAIWAILSVETGGCGFLPDRRPLILFERHIFHRRTSGIHDAGHPSISATTPGGYLGGAREYDRLAEAIALDRSAALESTSWGIAQIMGFNAGLAGFVSAEEMVAAMLDREDVHLRAMARFLQAGKLDRVLARHDWRSFARGYNGPDFSRNRYDARLSAAYLALAAGPLPDLRVRQTQVLLMFLGHDVGRIDGILGRRTRSAIVGFREERGLPSDDEIDDRLIEALVTAAGAASPLV
jgi:hypothetical protein